MKPSPTPTVTLDVDIQSNNTISPTLTINTDEQAAQLRLTYSDITKRLEDAHEQLISSLKAEWEQTAKERIRLQRLTLDYQQEQERLAKENLRWKKLYTKSLQEKPRVQSDGERKLLDATEKYSRIKQQYDQLIHDNHQ